MKEEGDPVLEEFDLDKYLRASKKVDLSPVRWDLIREHPLAVEEARCLAYMMDIETHTVVFLRDLLATRAALEPDITAFLSCWVYEELWHGEAFSRFLGEAGYRLGPDRSALGWNDRYPSRVDRNQWIRRKLGSKGFAAHFGTILGSAVVRDFAALHMTWGAANELTTLTAYHRLIERTDHPILRDLLNCIIKDERRHFAFYRSQARLRLGRSPRARAITRWALEHLWAPVGTGVRPQQETDHVIVLLFGDDDGGLKAALEIQDTMRELPGLEGTSVFEVARKQALARYRLGLRAPAASPPMAALRS